MDIYFIRHGETDWNSEGKAQGRSDIPLNGKGLRQAKQLRDYFKEINITAIYSSKSLRAHRTAEEISKDHELIPIIENGFLELDFGSLDGTPLNNMRVNFPDFYKQWEIDPSKADFPNSEENLTTLQKRTWSTTEKLANLHTDSDRIVIVSHAFAIYSVLCKALEMPLSNYGRLRLTPGSISILEATKKVPSDFIGTKWTLKQLNLHPSKEI